MATDLTNDVSSKASVFGWLQWAQLRPDADDYLAAQKMVLAMACLMSFLQKHMATWGGFCLWRIQNQTSIGTFQFEFWTADLDIYYAPDRNSKSQVVSMLMIIISCYIVYW